MLITCPYCGPRDLAEFSYQGDANRPRPDQHDTDQARWNAYVYDRTNPAGPHREYWQHAGGCRSHLLIVRSTLTHAIESVAFAGSRDATPRAARRAPKSRPKAGPARGKKP